jgi:enamine deaminase RidA (YjgF/YER057c/UK114 family)
VAEQGGGAGEQTRQCPAGADRLLALAGTGRTRMRQAQVSRAGAASADEMNRAPGERVPAGHAPARATGEARLVAPPDLAEVIVAAARF